MSPKAGDMHQTSRSRGFTIIELVVVLGIIIIVAAVGAPSIAA